MSKAMTLPPILCCPRCHGPLEARDSSLWCLATACALGKPFPTVHDQPVLIDFAESIISLDGVRAASSTAPSRRAQLGRSRLHRVYKHLTPGNPVAAANAEQLVTAMHGERSDPLLLVVGGGTRGAGTDRIWADDIRRLSFDIYASPNTHLVADAHRIPLADGSVDAVWIQAVLEHVLDPGMVVAEIERVLAPHGLVYAETPFLQHVHEGAYDFTRFTHSGHRWLFRGFEEIASGAIGSAGASTVWSLRHLAQAVTGSRAAGRAIAAALGWLGLLDRIGQQRTHLDSACGVFFLGRKSAVRLRPADMPAYYQERAHAS